MVKRPKKFIIVDDSSPVVAQAKSREKQVPSEFGLVITKTADRKTIVNYHTRGQTRKTIIDYHEEFEQAQTE